jgi:hypothetical protein
MKKCYRCGCVREANCFTRNQRYQDGKSSRCKTCDREVRRIDAAKYTSRNRGAPRSTREKTCPICGRARAADAFARQNSNPDGLYSLCRDCSRPNKMVRAARNRARAKRLACNLTPAYVRSIWPADDCCPIRKVKFVPILRRQGPHPDSPSLDRIDPALGYVMGNVAILSQAANRAKQNETDPAVFRRLADWLETAVQTARGTVAAQLFN